MKLNKAQRLTILVASITILSAAAVALLGAYETWKSSSESYSDAEVQEAEWTTEYWLAYDEDPNHSVPDSATLERYRSSLSRLRELTGATDSVIVQETRAAQVRFSNKYQRSVRAIDLMEGASSAAAKYPHLQWTYGELVALAALQYAEENGIELSTPTPYPVPTPAAVAP